MTFARTHPSRLGTASSPVPSATGVARGLIERGVQLLLSGAIMALRCSRPRGSLLASRPGVARVALETMGRQAAVVLYALALVAVVVGVDVLFFRHRFWERLMVNVGVVLVFAAFGLRFLKRP